MSEGKVTLNNILQKNNALKAFVFDLDGTLIDSQAGIVHTITSFLQEKGYNFVEEDISSLFGKPVEVVFHTLIPSLSKEEVWEFVLELRKNYAKNHLEITIPFPQTKSILESIKSKGYKLGLASTKEKTFVLEALNHFHLIHYFDVVVSGYEVKNHKPAPDILIETAKQLKVTPSECVYIGDSPSDIEAGKRAGTATIAILTGAATIEQMINSQPDFIIQSLDSLIIE